MAILIDVEKVFDEIQHFIIIKSWKTRNSREIPHMIKGTKHTHTANIMPSGEILKASPLRSRTKQGCLLSALQFNIALKTALRQEKVIKGIEIGKAQVKLLIFINDIISYIYI